MVKHVTIEDILERNPHIERKKLEELREAISKLHSDKNLGIHGREERPSPYHRPSVRREAQKTLPCRTVTTRRS